MDFRLGEGTDALRDEVGAFLDEILTPEVEQRLHATGVSHDEVFVEGLIERGWFAPGWSEADGGPGLDPTSTTVIYEELNKRDAPLYGSSVSLMVAKALLHFGTEEVRQEVIPRVLRGETICVLGFTEPEAGSDVANAQTRAVRDGDEWVIDGSKMFTTNAQIGDYAYLLTRTNPDVPKHKGLTTFLVPLKQEGIEVQAVYTLSGERTNITFYNDVRVPDSHRIGEVDGGWSVLTSSLMDEQAASFSPWIVSLLDTVREWAVATGRIDDPDVCERLGRASAEAEISLLLRRRCTWMDEQGLPRTVEGPMAKLYSSEALTRATEDLFDLVGPEALRSYMGEDAPWGRVEHLMRFALGTTIYAGTSEVQRSLIAQRGLGLPR